MSIPASRASAAAREGFDATGANILLTFPDAYEVGMSHQGLRILYHLLLARDDTFCDLAYTPWPDMEARMRAVQDLAAQIGVRACPP